MEKKIVAVPSAQLDLSLSEYNEERVKEKLHEMVDKLLSDAEETGKLYYWTMNDVHSINITLKLKDQ